MPYTPKRGRKVLNGIATVGHKHYCAVCGLWEDIGDTDEEANAWVAEMHAIQHPSPTKPAIYERGGYVPSATSDARGDQLMTALERARLVREAFDMLPLEAKVVAVEAGAEHWRKAEAREGRTSASCWQCEAPSK